jgi:DNA-binding response OmpR family regulator
MGAVVVYALMPPAEPGPARHRILTVEGDPDIAVVLRVLLEGAGYAVQWAGDLATARAILAGPRPPALVILELRLPDGSGLDLCREVKAARPALPVLVLTSWAWLGAREEAMARGADAFLMKPFDVDELAATVQRLAPAMRPDAPDPGSPG